MKVLIVDDHPLVRKGIVSVFAFEREVEEIYEASNVEEGLNKLANYSPEIAIIDLQLGRENGLNIVVESKQRKLETKFIILTSSSKKEDFIKAQQVGVDGYILKEAFAEDIIYAVHVVARGKKFFDSSILQYKTNDIKNNHLQSLTLRERDVLIELGKGLSNVQIAKKLYISENTVKKHISSILSKLGLRHRTEAALYANNMMNMGA